MTDLAEDRPAPIPPHEEEALATSAAVGAIWTGSRLLIGVCTFFYAAFGFGFFYLRSLNSYGRWHPHAQAPSVLLGTAATVLLLAAAAVHYFGLLRLRRGLNLDWRVASVATLGLGVFSVALQVFEMTRLNFFPGSSGYASMFVGWVPIHLIFVVGGLYWLETLVARSLRVRDSWTGQAHLTDAVSSEAVRHRASLDAFNTYFVFVALAGVVFWFLFYVVG
jgi:heme/copper-type cytochrome/quinol oxidase subunit 3